MPFAMHPLAPHDPALDLVTAALDPVLTPLGFAPGSAGASEGHGQVIYCRGLSESVGGGCLDLVVDLEPLADWRITDVRYWGLRVRAMAPAVPSRRQPPGAIGAPRSNTPGRSGLKARLPGVADTSVPSKRRA